MRVNILVEGYLDEAIARRLIEYCGHEAGITYGIKGWTYIQQKAAAFDMACGVDGLLTLVDLMDTKLECPSLVVNNWVPRRSHQHVFRVVMREIESWILADRNNMANFLSVPVVKLPMAPDLEDDPKRTLINLARTSKRKAIRDSLVPPHGISASEGPLYSSELANFVNRSWDPNAASENSDSLKRCINRLQELATQ